MRTLAYVLLFVAILYTHCAPAATELANNITAFGNYIIVDNLIVPSGISFEAHNIVVSDSLNITNFGTIHGGIEICENCVLELENTGVFDATVTMHPGARLVQVISSDAAATDIGLSDGYDVRVQNGHDITFNTVINIADNANTIELNNVELNAGRTSDFVVLSDVILHGNTMLVFDDVPSGDFLLFSDVNGEGAVYADSPSLDRLHILQTFVMDDDVYMRLARSTDYARILNNDMGRFLNDLRAGGNDIKLFSKLDRARTIGEIDNILSKSVRTNPIKLLRPMNLLYRHKMAETMYIDDFTVFGISPLIIYSDDVLISGIKPNVRFNIFDKLHMELSGYVLNTDYSDDINDYRGISYGVGARGQYDLSDKDFMRAYIGADISSFNIRPVFDGESIIDNPNGMTLHMAGEYARHFNILNEYTIMPFVLAGAEYMAIASSNDMNVFVGTGAEAGYKYEFDGLRYEYTLRTFVQTDVVVGIGVGMSVWSLVDSAGVDVRLGAIYDNDFGISCTASINGIFRF